MWRLLALLAMQRSFAERELVVPTTVASIRRACTEFYPAIAAELAQLERDFVEAQLAREASSGAARQRMERVYAQVAEG